MDEVVKDRFSEPQEFETGVRWNPTDPKGMDQTVYLDYLERNEDKTRAMQKELG